MRTAGQGDFQALPSQTVDRHLGSEIVLGVAELVLTVEDRFRVRLSPDSVPLMIVGDVVRHIDKLAALQQGGDAQTGAAMMHPSGMG